MGFPSLSVVCSGKVGAERVLDAVATIVGAGGLPRFWHDADKNKEPATTAAPMTLLRREKRLRSFMLCKSFF